MTRESRDKWVAALRSGEYVQGFGAFRRIVGTQQHWCALGLYYKVTGYLDRIDVMEYAAVLTMNDAERKPFSEIADWIEQNVAVTEL